MIPCLAGSGARPPPLHGVAWLMGTLVLGLACGDAEGGAAIQVDSATSPADSGDGDARASDSRVECPGRTSLCVQSLAASLHELDFGCVAPDTPAALTVSVENRATERVGPLGVFLAPAANLAIVSDGCGGQHLEGHQSCQVTVSFMAAGSTRVQSSLTVTTPGERYPAWVLVYAQSSPLAGKLPSPPPVVDFGEVKAGTSRTLEVVESNVSDAPVLSPFAELIDRGDNVGFQVAGDPCGGTTIPPLGTCRVTVTYAPRGAGPSEFLLDFGAGDACFPLPRTRLLGTATEALLHRRIPHRHRPRAELHPAHQLQVDGLR